ncbi:MAG: hypothetical protein RIC35_06290 [Marinoscillum sp.]
MKSLLVQLKWQLQLLNKNSIITISLVVTLIYGAILYFLKDQKYIDQTLIAFVLNDPSIIGYFFIALAIYTEMKQGVLQAIFVSPISTHLLLISKTLALSFIGVVCSLILAFAIKGLDFDIWTYVIGNWGICILCTLSGLIVLTYADEFLKFAMLSVLIFTPFVNIPMLHYLGAIDLGYFIYLFPIQGCVELLDQSVSEQPANGWFAYPSSAIWIVIFYIMAYRLFSRKIVHQ